MDLVVPTQKSLIDSGGITMHIPTRASLVTAVLTLTTLTFTVPAGTASAGVPDGVGITLDAPIVATAPTPDGVGYWLATADGGVFAYGDAPFYGSATAMNPDQPIVGMAATPDGGGYWLVGSDGGVFSFGNAQYYGSTAGKGSARIVGMAATPDGGGYWLVGSDGGVFAYGNATFHGSIAGQALNGPIVAITADGGGYRLVGSAGAVFAFGGASFYGAAGSQTHNQWVIGMAATPDGSGYWLVAFDGSVFTYGNAPFLGSLGAAHLVLITPAPPPAASDGVTDAERAAWERVAVCEEGGNWQANGSVFSGGLGITRSNWNAYGGPQFAPEGAQATEDQQIIVAMRISPNPPDQNGCTGSW